MLRSVDVSSGLVSDDDREEFFAYMDQSWVQRSMYVDAKYPGLLTPAVRERFVDMWNRYRGWKVERPDERVGTAGEPVLWRERHFYGEGHESIHGGLALQAQEKHRRRVTNLLNRSRRSPRISVIGYSRFMNRLWVISLLIPLISIQIPVVMQPSLTFYWPYTNLTASLVTLFATLMMAHNEVRRGRGDVGIGGGIGLSTVSWLVLICSWPVFGCWTKGSTMAFSGVDSAPWLSPAC